MQIDLSKYIYIFKMKMHKKITYMSLQRDSILKLYREQEAELKHFSWQSSPVDTLPET